MQQIFTANEAKTHFGKFLDQAQRGPVQVKRHDRIVGVMVSPQDYEAMRQFYANRLQHRFDQAADTAMQAGLTAKQLKKLLLDES